MRFVDLLLVGLGSALGGIGRHSLVFLITTRCGERFPWATLAANVLGSFLIGLLAAWPQADKPLWAAPAARHFLMVGLLGGFTTFSAFSLQTLALAKNGLWWSAALNAAGSVLLCLVAVTAGNALGHWLAKSP